MSSENKETISDQQRKAIRKYGAMLAEELNNHGFDMRKTLRHDVEIPWTGDMVIEFLWRQIQIPMFFVESTMELEPGQPGKVYEVLHKHIVELTEGMVDVPFPCMETLMESKLYG